MCIFRDSREFLFNSCISAESQSISKNRIAKAQNQALWKNFHRQTPTQWTNVERTSSTCGGLHRRSHSPSPLAIMIKTAQQIYLTHFVNMSDIFREVRQILGMIDRKICAICHLKFFETDPAKNNFEYCKCGATVTSLNDICGVCNF